MALVRSKHFLPKSSIRFSKAQSKDIPCILHGVQENCRLSFPQYKKTSDTIRIHRARIAQGLRDKRQKIYLAQMNEEKIGFIWIRFESTDISLERFAYIQSIWVSPKWRRKGVGKELLKQAQRHASRAGYRKIRSTYTSSNLSIQKFMMRNGFKIKRILVEKSLKVQKTTLSEKMR